MVFGFLVTQLEHLHSEGKKFRTVPESKDSFVMRVLVLPAHEVIKKGVGRGFSPDSASN